MLDELLTRKEIEVLIDLVHNKLAVIALAGREEDLEHARMAHLSAKLEERRTALAAGTGRERAN